MTYPPSPGGVPTWTPQGTWGPQGLPQVTDTRAADLDALTQVRTAALISVVGSALGVAFPLALSLSGHFNITIPASGGTVTIDQTALVGVLGIALFGLVLSMLAFWFFRGGFLSLRSVDQRFSTAPTWALLTIVGLVLVGLGLVLFLGGFVQLLACIGPSSSIPASCIPLGLILGGAALLLIGVIVLLIGYIGTLVAIWRLGTRYDDSMFKIGAVLFIIPFLSIVGQILVLVAASGARTKIQQRPVLGLAPSVPSYPRPPPY